MGRLSWDSRSRQSHKTQQ